MSRACRQRGHCVGLKRIEQKIAQWTTLDLRTLPGPGQPAGNCEAGNENYIQGKAVLGNVPGVTGTTHEITTREQNLFSEKYPAETLKDLGLPTTPAKSTASKASAAPAKGKS